MALVDIDENELMQLRTLQGVASKMMSHPEGKKLLEQAHKLVDPAAATPTLDQDRAFREPIDKALDEVKSLKEQLASEKAEREKAEKLASLNRQVEDGLAALRRDGWQDDGIEAVRKLMDEKGILDPSIAAAYIEKQHPPQAPAAPSGYGAWDFQNAAQEDNDYTKQLLGAVGPNTDNSDAFATREAKRVLQEMQGAGPRR